MVIEPPSARRQQSVRLAPDDESGQALPVVLVLITVIFLLGTSLAGKVSVALRATSGNVAGASSVYAADGAAELAIWWQRQGRPGNPPSITLNGVTASAMISVAGGTPSGSGWPQIAFDANSSASSGQAGPATYSQRFSAPNLGPQATAFSSPVVGRDGYLYVGSSGSSPGLYAYRPDGTLAYSWSTGDTAIQVSGTPALLTTSGGARMIVVATNATTSATASTIYGLTENSGQTAVSVTWSYSVGTGAGRGFLAGVKLNSSGSRAYVGAQNGIVYAFDTGATGTVIPLWTTTLGAWTSVATPVVLNGNGSRLYAVTTGNDLYALSTTSGAQQWSVAIHGGQVTLTTPVFRSVNGRDHIYLVTGGDRQLRTYADLGSSPTVDWTISFNKGGSGSSSYAYGPPALGASGQLYVGLDNGEIWKIEDQGTTVCSPESCPSGSEWVLSLSGSLRAGPARGNDGALYFGNTAGSLYRVLDNGSNGSSSWSQALGLGAIAAGSDLAIGNDTDLYGFTSSGRLFAVGPAFTSGSCTITASAGGSSITTGYSLPWTGSLASWTVTP
jgi:hypothetical protein